MRPASSGLINYLNTLRANPDPQAIVADCYTFTLRRGVILTYTNPDVLVTLNGYVYAANSILVDGLRYKSSIGLEVDQQQISIAARLADTTNGGAPFLQALRNGTFDGCEIQRERTFPNSWSPFDTANPIGSVILFKGCVGAVDSIGRTSAQVTVNSDLVLLDLHMPRNVYSPFCQHVLYDSGCGANGGPIKSAHAVTGAVGSTSSIPYLVINWTGAIANLVLGTITFSSGANAGVSANIKSVVAGAALTFSYPVRAIAGRYLHSLLGLRPHSDDLHQSIQQSWELPWVPVCPRTNLHVVLILDEIETKQRAAVIAEVRSWLRTPYHPQGDVKGAGVDCGMLLVRVFVDTGLCEPFDPRPYAPDWMLHRSEERYLGFVFDRTKEVERPHPGDVMLFRFGHCYSHGGIVTRSNPVTIVHAFQPARAVIEDEVMSNTALCNPGRMPKFFSYWVRH